MQRPSRRPGSLVWWAERPGHAWQHAELRQEVMSWHTTQRDDAWRQVTLDHLDCMGRRVRVHCHCGYQRVVEPSAFAAQIGLPMATPLLTIAWRLRCTACGERKVAAWPEPFGIPGSK